jgi:hypothetical protein
VVPPPQQGFARLTAQRASSQITHGWTPDFRPAAPVSATA